MAVSWSTGARQATDASRALFEVEGIRGFRVAPDRKRFLLPHPHPRARVVTELEFVLDLFEELRRLAP